MNAGTSEKAQEFDLSPRSSRTNLTALVALTVVAEKAHRYTPVRMAEVKKTPKCNGGVINMVTVKTQTNWEWVEQRSPAHSCAKVSIGDGKGSPRSGEELQSVLQGLTTSFYSMNEGAEVEDSQETVVNGIPSVGPPPLLAYQPESRQLSDHLAKVCMVSSTEHSGDQTIILCDYCQQPTKPFISRDELENNPNPEKVFCCGRAQAERDLLLDVERTLAALDISRKSSVSTHPPFATKWAKKAAKERAEQKVWEAEGAQDSDIQNRLHSGGSQFKTVSYRLSDEVEHVQETLYDQLGVSNMMAAFPLQGHTWRDIRRKHVLRFYPNGLPFLAVFPDGTGTIFYPSGVVAVLISSAEDADFIYILMEDKQKQPNMLAIFTSRGHSTCYHPNGLIWVNTTQLGGVCFTEMGTLRRRWSWLDPESHVHAPPFQPVCIALSKCVSVRIQPEQCMLQIRFTIDSIFKLSHPEAQTMPGADPVHVQLQIKHLQVYSLLNRPCTHMAIPHRILSPCGLLLPRECLTTLAGRGGSPPSSRMAKI